MSPILTNPLDHVPPAAVAFLQVSLQQTSLKHCVLFFFPVSLLPFSHNPLAFSLLIPGPHGAWSRSWLILSVMSLDSHSWFTLFSCLRGSALSWFSFCPIGSSFLVPFAGDLFMLVSQELLSPWSFSFYPLFFSDHI